MAIRLKLSALITLTVIMALMFGMMPGLAQDTTSEDELTIVTGAVEFAPNGDILVAGVVIAPSGAFNPSMLQPGDIVIVIGTLTSDGTLKAISLELFDGEEPEVTPEPTLEVTPEVTPEATLEATPEVTPEPTLEVTPEVTPEPTLAPDCNRPDHPVAQAIANAYGVSYAEVMNFHCQGMGFGNIVRAYELARLGGGTANQYLERHRNGEGWGNIRKDSDVNPSDLAPGKVLKPCKKDCDPVVGAPPAAPPADANNQNNGNPGNGNPGNGNKDKDKDKGNNGNAGGNNGNAGGNNGNAGGNNGNAGGNGGGKGKK